MQYYQYSIIVRFVESEDIIGKYGGGLMLVMTAGTTRYRIILGSLLP